MIIFRRLSYFQGRSFSKSCKWWKNEILKKKNFLDHPFIMRRGGENLRNFEIFTISTFTWKLLKIPKVELLRWKYCSWWVCFEKISLPHLLLRVTPVNLYGLMEKRDFQRNTKELKEGSEFLHMFSWRHIKSNKYVRQPVYWAWGGGGGVSPAHPP